MDMVVAWMNNAHSESGVSSWSPQLRILYEALREPIWEDLIKEEKVRLESEEWEWSSVTKRTL